MASLFKIDVPFHTFSTDLRQTYVCVIGWLECQTGTVVDKAYFCYKHPSSPPSPSYHMKSGVFAGPNSTRSTSSANCQTKSLSVQSVPPSSNSQSQQHPLSQQIDRQANLLDRPKDVRKSSDLGSVEADFIYQPRNHLEWAPPMRVIAAITLFASTLDLMADFLLCSRLAEFLHNFQTDMARYCAYGYFFFTGVSILVYIFEITDVCLTLKNDEEDVYFARLAKSMVLVLEEVPLPTLLYFLFTAEPRLSLANPMYISSWIKLITLIWGIVKFAKLRFFWPLLPFNPKHDRQENIRRCFHFKLYRVTMLVVNTFHILAIFIVINNLIVSGKGGRPIHVQSSVN